MKCKCGSSAFYKVSKTSGTWSQTFEYVNGRKEFISSDTDGLKQIEPKTIRCADCGTRYPNPDFK